MRQSGAENVLAKADECQQETSYKMFGPEPY